MQTTFEKPIAVGVVTGSAAFLVVVSSCPAHMALYTLGLPPRMGVDVSVLQVLENELWDEMNMAIDDSTVHSPQSSSTVLGEGLAFFTLTTRNMNEFK